MVGVVLAGNKNVQYSSSIFSMHANTCRAYNRFLQTEYAWKTDGKPNLNWKNANFIYPEVCLIMGKIWISDENNSPPPKTNFVSTGAHHKKIVELCEKVHVPMHTVSNLFFFTLTIGDVI